MVKPVMRPSNSCRPPYMSTSSVDPLADPQVGQLRLLEVGVDPDLGERADRHQVLADLDVVAGVDVAAGDHAVDLADDVAVAEVQLGLGQVALGLHPLGLGLSDLRGIGVN